MFISYVIHYSGIMSYSLNIFPRGDICTFFFLVIPDWCSGFTPDCAPGNVRGSDMVTGSKLESVT